MKKKLISLAIAAAVTTPFAAQAAGSLTVANQDITMSGGVTGAYIYNSDTKRDDFMVTDALIDLSSEAKAGGMGFDLGIGTLGMNTLTSSFSTLFPPIGTDLGGTPGSVAVQYGYLSVMPTDTITIDAGILPTNVGYEVAPSYSDGNILRGMVWNGQPVYYNGARATYSSGGTSVYAEASKLLGAGDSWAVGGSTTMGPVDGSLNLFSAINQGSMVDIILSGKAGSFDLAANFDYTVLADAAKTPGADDNAYALALYATTPLSGNWTLPMRLEYVDDGSSGIYMGVPGTSNNAYTFTITPTYNFTDSTFVRAELAYISTDQKSGALVDDSGVAQDSNITVGFQAGVLL